MEARNRLEAVSLPETKRWTSKNTYKDTNVFKFLRKATSAGTPLPKVEMLFQKYDALYQILVAFTGSPKRAEMLRYALKVQALNGLAFCSAKRYAGQAIPDRQGFASEKTWDRLLSFLKAEGLVKVERLYKFNGKQSVNLINFVRLWRLLLKLLAHRIGSLIQHIKGVFFIKLSGAWFSRDTILQLHLRGHLSAGGTP